MTRRQSVTAAALLLLLGCGAPPDDGGRELTRRERDSMLGASEVIPGAAGVRGALRASDSATARNDRLDSVGRAP